MGISFVERIMGRTEISFESPVRCFMSSSVTIDIVITDCAVYGYIQFLCFIYIRWKESGWCVPEDISAIQSEYITIGMLVA